MLEVDLDHYELEHSLVSGSFSRDGEIVEADGMAPFTGVVPPVRY